MNYSNQPHMLEIRFQLMLILPTMAIIQRNKTLIHSLSAINIVLLLIYSRMFLL